MSETLFLFFLSSVTLCLLLIIFFHNNKNGFWTWCSEIDCPIESSNRSTECIMKWHKAVIFNEKAIIASKEVNTNMQELSAYFKAYDSRDNTIGQGTPQTTQVSFFKAITSMCTGSTLLWSTEEEAMPKTVKESAWLLERPNKVKRCTYWSLTCCQSFPQGQSPSK